MDGEPIDFLKKKAEKMNSVNAEVAIRNFISWAWNSTKTIAAERALDPNDYKVRFNNRKIRGEFAYENHRDEKRRTREETCSFVEFGGENRVIQFSVENGKKFVICHKYGQTEEPVDMTPEETLKFLEELGSPFEITDRFPYEPDLRTIK